MNQDRSHNGRSRNNNGRGTTKVVYAITEKGEKSFWTRVGVAYVNRDASLTIKLDALPVSGTLQVRDDDRGERGDNNT